VVGQRAAGGKQDRHRGDDVACSPVAIATRATEFDRREKSRDCAACCVPGVWAERSRGADGLSHVPLPPRRRRLRPDSGGEGIVTRETHRSADVVKKVLNLAEKS